MNVIRCNTLPEYCKKYEFVPEQKDLLLTKLEATLTKSNDF